MTQEESLRQIVYAQESLRTAKTDGERRAAMICLETLHQLAAQAVNNPWTSTINEFPDKPKRKPRKKLTAVEKFDKKNSRREAIMAQKARNG